VTGYLTFNLNVEFFDVRLLIFKYTGYDLGLICWKSLPQMS